VTDRSIVYSALHAVRRRYWRLAGPRTVGVRGLVIDGEGQVLLVRHSYGAMGWHLPGGGVKRREHLTDATVRELREEAGVVVDDGMPMELFGAYSNLDEGKSDYIVVFAVRAWRRVSAADNEIVECAFYDPAAPPAGTSAGTRRRLAELTGSATPSHTW
jgi:ADP-ribose pyrophosphatase YjhB (NUDIX family)